MNQLSLSLIATAALAAATTAQAPTFLLTYSQPEMTNSGSGGTVLGQLLPNEIAYVDFTVPCALASAEKWMPRTCTHVMAGDEDGDGVLFENNLLGRIDALVTTANWTSPVGGDTQRSIYYSPSQPMGTTISGGPGLRPGDIGRIVRIGAADGQVQHFITQELLNNALGLPPAYAIDIDAAAFQPNYGLFFSVDADVIAMTMCGPMMIRDGDVLCLPGGTMGYTSDLRVAATTPNSAVVVYSEAQMNVFTANAQVTDRFGACVTTVGDVESLEMDLFGPTLTLTPCPGVTVPVPNLYYSCENGTGASLLQIAGGGSIVPTPCGLAGTPCSSGGPTFGPQMGVRPASTTTGVASFVNALANTRVCTHTLEPQQHVVFSPAPPVQVDYNNPFVLSLILIELVSPVVPASVPAFPFSPTCFPDLYAPSIISWTPVGPGFGSFPTPAFPAAFTGKVLFQGVGFSTGTFELSTPAVIDVL
jgi:hypothetical protein